MINFSEGLPVEVIFQHDCEFHTILIFIRAPIDSSA